MIRPFTPLRPEDFWLNGLQAAVIARNNGIEDALWDLRAKFSRLIGSLTMAGVFSSSDPKNFTGTSRQYCLGAAELRKIESGINRLGMPVFLLTPEFLALVKSAPIQNDAFAFVQAWEAFSKELSESDSTLSRKQ